MKRRYVSGTKAPRPHYNMLQQVRAHLGLTQQDVAHLLNVSRSAVALDEHGTRTLPGASVARVLALLQVLPAPAGPAPLPPEPPLALTAADRTELDFRRQGLALQVYVVTQQLKRPQLQLAQARLWQQALPALRKSFPATDTDWHDWLNRFEGRAASVLQFETGSAVRLQLRLATLTFEVAEITRLLATP